VVVEVIVDTGVFVAVSPDDSAVEVTVGVLAEPTLVPTEGEVDVGAGGFVEPA
jgi:hypothetical protein